MKSLSAYIITSGTNRFNTFLTFLQKLPQKITVQVSSRFSKEKIARANLLFVDESTARKYCREITEIKSETGLFPVILLASENFDPESETLPGCIDDVVMPSFVPSLWERRLQSYTALYVKGKKQFSTNGEEYKSLFRENHSIMLLIDPGSGKIVDANKAACNFYGYHYHQLTQMTIHQLNTLPKEKVKQEMIKARTGQKDHFIFSHKLANGQVKTVEVYSGKVKHRGKILLYSVIHDITGAETTRKALKEQEENYRQIIENAPDIIVLIDPSGIIKYVNRRIYEYGKYQPEEIIGRPVTQFIPPEDHARVKEAVQRVFESNRETNFFSTSLLLRNGKKLPILTKGILLKFGGEVLNMTVIRDISPIKEVENRLKESKETFENIFNNRSVAIYIQDQNGVFLDINRAALMQYGYHDKKSLIGKTPDFVVAKGKTRLSDIKKYLQAAFEGKPQHFEFWAKRSDGTVFPKLVQIEKGTWFGKPVLYNFSFDITERKKTEEALQDSEEKFNAIFNSSPSPAHLVNRKFEIVLANKKLLALTGKTLKEVTGKKCYAVFQQKDDVCENCAVQQVFEKGDPASTEGCLITSEGETRYYNTLAYPIRDNRGNIRYAVESTLDITEAKKTAEKLKQSEENYRLLFEKAPFGIFIVHPNGTILDANPVLLKIVGSPSLEATKKINVKDFPLLVQAGYVEYFQQCLSTGKIIRFKTDYTSKWGKSFVAESTFVPLKDKKGNIQKVYTILRDITDQERVEQQLKESENKYRSLAETSSDLILTFDINGKFTYLNPALEKITGYKPEEVMEKPFWDFIAPEYVTSTIEKFKRGLQGEHIPLYEIELLHKTGKRVPVELNVTSLYDAQGKVTGRIVVARDITERKAAAKALKESELRLKRFSQITTEGIIFHKDGSIFDANQAILRMLGYTLEDLIGQHIVKKLALPKYYPMIDEHLRKDYSEPYDIEIYKKDGSILPVEVAGVNYTDNMGKTFRASVFRDISRRIRMEKALRESENKYRSLAETSIDMILTYDLEGNITYVNPAVKNIFGYDPDEITGKKFTDFVVTKDVEKAVENFIKGKSGYSVPLYELEIKHKNGKSIPVEINPTSLHDAEGNIIGRLTIVRDITARKKAEQNLRLLAKALNAAANAVIITDATGTIEWINQAFTTLTGYSKEEAIGKHSKDLIESNQQDQAFFDELNRIVLSGKVWKGEIIDKRKDGTLYVVEEIITPVTNARGEVEHLIGIMTDITERKEAERELLAAKEAAEEASRLKSAFLANMNHEIRTPMNAIMGFSNLMLETVDEQVRENYARIINNSAEQLLKLIDDVIYLSRLQSEKLPLKKIVFHPADIVREIYEMFSLPHMKKNLEIKLSIPEQAGQILMKADDYKIKQILTNFVSNALKYTPEGSVEIGFKTEGKDLLFFVKDTGIGIPEEEQKHIFEAFYRGEEAVSSAIRGTGLGLNIAKELVELMGGTIGVKSQPGKGSCFFFSLPCDLAETTTPPQKKPKKSPAKLKNMDVLIVEDDETNYLYFNAVLKNVVHKTDRARNGQEAVEKVHHRPYHLILMDIKMPVMDGYEATRRMKKYNPSLPVIATTAYATQEEKEKAIAAGCDEYLSKPVKKQTLLALLEKYGGRK